MGMVMVQDFGRSSSRTGRSRAATNCRKEDQPAKGHDGIDGDTILARHQTKVDAIDGYPKTPKFGKQSVGGNVSPVLVQSSLDNASSKDQTLDGICDG